MNMNQEKNKKLQTNTIRNKNLRKDNDELVILSIDKTQN